MGVTEVSNSITYEGFLVYFQVTDINCLILVCNGLSCVLSYIGEDKWEYFIILAQTSLATTGEHLRILNVEA